LLRNTYG